MLERRLPKTWLALGEVMRRSNRAPWTDADDAELVALELARTPRRDSAEQLGRTQAAIETRIMRLRRRGLV